MIISVRNDMQNMGKSIVSWLMANAIALKYPKKVVWLVDTDPQGTLTNWAKISPNLPKGFEVMTPKEFDTAEGSPDFTVIDTEKSLSRTNKKLSEMVLNDSDIILLPSVLTTGFKEYGAMVDMVEDIKQSPVKSKFFVVFNKVKATDTALLNERIQYARIHKCNPLTAYVSDNAAVETIFSSGSLPQYVNNTAINAEFEAILKEITS